MSFLKKLQKNKGKKVETQADRTGLNVITSGLYKAKVAKIYGSESQGGAGGLAVTFETSDGEIRQTEYITSGDAKGNKTYYTKDGHDIELPGFNWGNAISLLTCGEGIMETEWKEKKVKIYDFSKGKEVKKKVPVPVDILKGELMIGVIVTHVDIAKKDSNGISMYKNGKAVPSGEFRTINVVDKLFDASSKGTVAEIREGIEPVFFEKWLKANEGKERDLTHDKIQANPGHTRKDSGGSSTKGTSTDTRSLFMGSSAGDDEDDEE